MIINILSQIMDLSIAGSLKMVLFS
jgi:hypothetical protein